MAAQHVLPASLVRERAGFDACAVYTAAWRARSPQYHEIH